MFSKHFRIKLLNFYPPFLGAGIHITYVSEDLLTVEARMKLHWWNRNAVGTHFGGSLYALCDPFYMLILMEQMGPNYIIWDKTATIRFKRPGRSTVTARFHISPQRVEDIRAEIDRIGRKDYTFHTQVFGPEGEVIAEVEKLVYVRRKDFVYSVRRKNDSTAGV
jgi:acyl-coenzyme A thioesterase PaaI-like protein